MSLKEFVFYLTVAGAVAGGVYLIIKLYASKKETEEITYEIEKTISEIILELQKSLKQDGLIDDNFISIKYKAEELFKKEIQNIISTQSNLQVMREKLLTLLNQNIDEIPSLTNYKNKVLKIFDEVFPEKYSGKDVSYIPFGYQSFIKSFGITTDDAREALRILIFKLIEDGTNKVKRKITVNIEWLAKSQEEEKIRREIEEIRKELELE